MRRQRLNELCEEELVLETSRHDLTMLFQNVKFELHHRNVLTLELAKWIVQSLMPLLQQECQTLSRKTRDHAVIASMKVARFASVVAWTASAKSVLQLTERRWRGEPARLLLAAIP